MADQKKGSAGTKKYGRNKDKCARYRALHFREKHKLKRVLRSSGAKEATRYATKHGLTGYLASLV